MAGTTRLELATSGVTGACSGYCNDQKMQYLRVIQKVTKNGQCKIWCKKVHNWDCDKEWDCDWEWQCDWDCDDEVSCTPTTCVPSEEVTTPVTEEEEEITEDEKEDLPKTGENDSTIQIIFGIVLVLIGLGTVTFFKRKSLFSKN